METKTTMGLSLLSLTMLFLATNSATTKPPHPLCLDSDVAILKCGEFLTQIGSALVEPGDPCCSGVERIVRLGDTMQNRQELCDCLVRTANFFKFDLHKAKKLVKICKVSEPIPFIYPGMDCKEVKA